MKSDLFARLESSGKLPTPPGVVLKLLELTRQPDVSVKEIADTIAADPGLSAKILRFANSPIAGIGREVTSLIQAVNLQGIRGVKMMALSFSVLSQGPSKACPGFHSDHHAVQSLACGVAAKSITALTRLGSSQEAFSAGLLSQIGRAALAAAAPKEYAPVLATAKSIPRDLPALEQTAIGSTYAAVGGQLLRTWGIPETLCRAVETFRTPDAGVSNWLAGVLDVAEIAATVLCPDGTAPSGDSAAFVNELTVRYGVAADQGVELLRRIAAEVEETRKTLEIPKGRLRTCEEIESEVKERITELSLAMHMENQSLARQQEELLRRATTDPLTGVGNRAAFDARMSLELERALRTASPFGLLMIDVDKFKSINDTYGHQVGDRVLQSVARLLDDSVRKIDYVARYGGEEFAVIAPSTPLEGLLLLAERLRGSIESMPLVWEGKDLRITVSIGVGLLPEVTDAREAAVTVIRAADEQLYAAKCAGRNRVACKGAASTRPAAALAGAR